MSEAVRLAGRIIKIFQTRDIYEITRKAGVKIIFQNWHPATAGEFNHQTRTIYVNGNAGLPVEKVLAHELCHYFMREFEVDAGVVDEECFCDEFAEALLK